MTEDVNSQPGPQSASQGMASRGMASQGAASPGPDLSPLRQAQIRQTEERIIAAATELFVADGYVATTLEAVARRAQVGARTVYVRFGTKAALFKRVVDVAIVGDTLPIDVLGRDWAQAALTAPTAAERIAAGAAMGRQIMERTGALFAVAQQAAAVEPLIAGFWQQGREQSRHAQAVFWTRMAEDGLLDPGVDLGDRHRQHPRERGNLSADYPPARLGPRRVRELARHYLGPALGPGVTAGARSGAPPAVFARAGGAGSGRQRPVVRDPLHDQG
jgi:AcrR family transcriptional regulator